MQVNNESPWQYLIAPMWTLDKKLSPVLVVKAGFRWDDKGDVTALSEADYEIEPVDRFFNDDADIHSLEASADAVPFKQGFEWWLYGTAQAVDQTQGIEVTVEFFNESGQTIAQKSLIVTGERHWEKELLGWMPGEAARFTSCELRYEYAFGGVNPDDPEDAYLPNPVGMGFGANLTQPVMPRIQQKPLLTNPSQTTVPAGFGPIARHWQPRVDQWQALDADAALLGGCPYGRIVATNLYNAAPADQQLTQPISEGSVVQLTGLHATAVQRFKIPKAEPQVMVNRKPHALTCDTLIIDADKQQFYLVYRLALNVPVEAMLSMQLDLHDEHWSLDEVAKVLA